MKIIQANQASFDPRPQMSRIFVEGFYPWIKHINEDKNLLIKVFTHIFDLEWFYIAVEDEKIAAMAACTNSAPPVKLCRKEFSQALGPLRGNISYFILRRHMMNNSMPFPICKKTGVIEFVTTAPESRKQGIGQALLSHIMATSPHDSYILEVADTNSEAMRLYERLGFKEFKRVRASKRSGVNAFIYMRYSAALKL